MDNPFVRTEWLIGADALAVLKQSHVAVFGVGGVGSYVTEALVRSGVGEFTLIDHDTVAESNINRQLHALHSTVGQKKASVMGERLLDINPSAKVHIVAERFLPDGHLWDFSYIVDAVDTVSCKMEIILEAKKRGIPVISSMGAGNRLDPSKFKIADIYKTKGCPLAKTMRNLCRVNGIADLKVVFSEELPVKKQREIGSIAFVPSVAGLMIASEAVKDLIERN
jgi:tRNA A37 threonylcarbamoyladenosine dehydratase